LQWIFKPGVTDVDFVSQPSNSEPQWWETHSDFHQTDQSLVDSNNSSPPVVRTKSIYHESVTSSPSGSRSGEYVAPSPGRRKHGAESNPTYPSSLSGKDFKSSCAADSPMSQSQNSAENNAVGQQYSLNPEQQRVFNYIENSASN